MLSNSSQFTISTANNELRLHQDCLLGSHYIFQKNKPLDIQEGRIHIRSITTKNDFQLFLDIPRTIYQHDKGWIPPLWNDEKNFFKIKNRFWSHADAILYIVLMDDRPVGRIAGIVDDLFMKQTGEKTGFFGFYESINNVTMANHLLLAVEHWAKSRNCTNLIGPVNGRVDNGAGFLFNTFESQPTILDSYSPPYYLDFMEQNGFQKHRDLYTFSVDLTQPLSANLKANMEKTKNTYHITLRRFNRWRSRAELNWWIPFFLETFSSHWGYVPVDFKEVLQRYGLRNIRWVGDDDLFIIAENNEGPVGYLWGTPDYNQVFKKINGNITLLSALKHLRTLKTIDYGKLNVIGVKKDYQNKQLALLLNYEVLTRMQKRGYKGADIGWIDEHNKKALKVIEKMDVTHHKTFRVYEKEINISR
jgi:GNAT superfamily N-acetyltransferase